jgi:hypothetical protein
MAAPAYLPANASAPFSPRFEMLSMFRGAREIHVILYAKKPSFRILAFAVTTAVASFGASFRLAGRRTDPRALTRSRCSEMTWADSKRGAKKHE